jgi:hypothetical protein
MSESGSRRRAPREGDEQARPSAVPAPEPASDGEQRPEEVVSGPRYLSMTTPTDLEELAEISCRDQARPEDGERPATGE